MAPKKNTKNTRKQNNKRTSTNFRNKVLKIIKSKVEPKFLKTPANACTFTTGTYNNATNVAYSTMSTQKQGTEFLIHKWELPQGGDFQNSTTAFGDSRKAYENEASSSESQMKEQIINLSSITARLEYGTSYGPTDFVIVWYLVNVKTMGFADFQTAVRANKIVVPYKSIRTATQQRSIQQQHHYQKYFTILASGKQSVLRSVASTPSNQSIYINHKFGQNGKRVRFENATDSVGNLGNLYLLTSISSSNGQPTTENVSYTGLLTTYFNDIIAS